METLPANIDDGFATALSEDSRIVGEFVKFVKGNWILGRDEGTINGMVLCVYDRLPVWQKWRDSEVVASIFPEVDQAFPTNADEADFADPDDGPGEWSLARYLYMSNLNTRR
jgi:hypothetical protein